MKRDLTRLKYYIGDPQEVGGTAIKGKEGKVMRGCQKAFINTEGMRVLEWGAGHGRNARYLRSLGFKVYAYDPYNYDSDNGWEGVSNEPPYGEDDFDVAFTCYVMNVIPFNMERSIVDKLKIFSPKQFHITRSDDLVKTVKSALYRGNKVVVNFYLSEYRGERAPVESKTRSRYIRATEEDVRNFLRFGIKTRKGFQRIPELSGFKLWINRASYRVYVEGEV